MDLTEALTLALLLGKGVLAALVLATIWIETGLGALLADLASARRQPAPDTDAETETVDA